MTAISTNKFFRMVLVETGLMLDQLGLPLIDRKSLKINEITQDSGKEWVALLVGVSTMILFECMDGGFLSVTSLNVGRSHTL